MDIKGKLNQAIVLWTATGENNKFGRSGFNAGVEYQGRWRSKSVEFISRTGKKELSDSLLHFAEADVVPSEDDRAYLGTLAGLSAPQQASPLLVPTSEIIRSVKKTPSVETDQTLITALTKA